MSYPNITYSNDDTLTHTFLQQWQDDNDYVEAHTSGSTGSPKDISLLKSDMIASARSTCKYFNITEQSFLVCPLSADYIAGKMMIVRAIVSGATLVMEHPSNTPASTPYYRDISLISIVPSQLDGLIKATNLNHFDNVIVGGAPLSSRQIEQIIENQFNAYATYGMTETCSHVALKHIAPNNNLYTALPHFSFSTDNRDCIVINTDSQSFGSITTNDIVTLHDEHNFTWLGRYDNVIITGGLKVHPESIEQIIAPLIKNEFYISSSPDDKWGQHIVLNIEGDSFDTTTLLNLLKSLLKPHQLPREIKFHRQFQRTSSGKIKRTH